jgi:hypothetical protein
MQALTFYHLLDRAEEVAELLEGLLFICSRPLI